MPLAQTENLNIAAFDRMPSPEDIVTRVPLTDAAASVVLKGRQTLQAILVPLEQRLRVIDPIEPGRPRVLGRGRPTKAGAEQQGLVAVRQNHRQQPEQCPGICVGDLIQDG